VDVAASGGAGLVKRFNFSALPAALLLRDRAMYVLDLASSAGEGGGAPAADADAIAGRVHAFVDGGYEQQVGRRARSALADDACAASWPAGGA
jgi:hypothetical protein